MNKPVCIFVFLLVTAWLHGQVYYSYVGFGNEKTVRKDLRKASADKENIGNGYVFNEEKKGDTLIITAMGPETTIRKLTFKGELNTCDFDQILLASCDSCTKYQIETILNDKDKKWKKIAENTYLSRYFWQQELTLTYNAQNYCTIMTFREVLLDKKEYLKLYAER